MTRVVLVTSCAAVLLVLTPNAHAFTFIACNADIARVRDFMASLTDRLTD